MSPPESACEREGEGEEGGREGREGREGCRTQPSVSGGHHENKVQVTPMMLILRVSVQVRGCSGARIFVAVGIQ